MRFFSLSRVVFIIYLIIYPLTVYAIPGSSLIKLIENTAQKQGIHVVPLTSKIRVWPDCAGELLAKPIRENWKTVTVECADDMGPAWRAVIRNRLLGTTYGQETGAPLKPKSISTKIQKDYKKEKFNFDNRKKNFLSKPQINVVKYRIPLKNNTIIRSSDLYIAKSPANQSQLHFRRKSDVVGRKTKSYVAANIAVAPRHLQTRWDIYKGDNIPIYRTFGAIRISASGVVLNDAQVGGRVLVKNLNSGRVLKGILEKGKKIKIFSKQLR